MWQGYLSFSFISGPSEAFPSLDLHLAQSPCNAIELKVSKASRGKAVVKNTSPDYAVFTVFNRLETQHAGKEMYAFLEFCLLIEKDAHIAELFVNLSLDDNLPITQENTEEFEQASLENASPSQNSLLKTWRRSSMLGLADLWRFICWTLGFKLKEILKWICHTMQVRSSHLHVQLITKLEKMP